MFCLGQGSDPTGSDSSNFSSDVEKSKTGHNRPTDRQPPQQTSTTSTSHLPPQGYQPQGKILLSTAVFAINTKYLKYHILLG